MAACINLLTCVSTNTVNAAVERVVADCFGMVAMLSSTLSNFECSWPAVI